MRSTKSTGIEENTCSLKKKHTFKNKFLTVICESSRYHMVSMKSQGQICAVQIVLPNNSEWHTLQQKQQLHSHVASDKIGVGLDSFQ